MDKNKRAIYPPMGWNSWDCYGASVNEEQLRGNADYMAKYLKQYGWEYVVCDIQWYEPTADSCYYHKFTELVMDEYSRLMPAENRFPSAAGGKGFKPIADYVHSLGLKFGIHIMRGIPRQAVHQNTKIKGADTTARAIAHPYSICSWNTDMYGVDPHAYGAQEYYNSLFELYASWGVDYVKVDDICVTEFRKECLYSAKEEIELIHNAINNCGRDMVLSLSPGPAQIEQAEHLSKYANMWRMTGDLWDNWPSLKAMFERCRIWAPHVKEGCWPDCDMLPLGHILVCRDNEEHMTNLTRDEQTTLMTLWCIFRSPLMMGGELRDNDAFTLSLLTNEEVLALEKTTSGAKEVMDTDGKIAWKTTDADGNVYVGLFNTTDEETEVSCEFALLGLTGEKKVRDLWAKTDIGSASGAIAAVIPAHGAKLYKMM